MIPDLLASLELVCPACRRVTDGGWIDHPLEVAEVCVAGEGGAVRHGILACSGEECPARYPVVDGIPVILRDVPAWAEALRRDLARRGVPGPVADLLDPAREGPEAEGRIHRSVHVRAHYGDRLDARGEPRVPALEDLREDALADRLDRVGRLADAVGEGGRVIDLGAGPGRMALECAARGARVLAVDLDLESLRVPARVARDGVLSFDRWEGGTGWTRVRRDLPDLATDRLLCCVADATDPPCRPAAFDGAVLCDVVDSVDAPLTLCRQAHAILRPGGRLLVTTPYHWLPDVTPVEKRLGGDSRAIGGPADSADVLCSVLEGDRPEAPEVAFRIDREAEAIPWVLPRYPRGSDTFVCHVVEGAKQPAEKEEEG